MNIIPAHKRHALEIMGWFPDRNGCVQWGGPEMRFPLQEASFFEDIHWGRIHSCAALTGEGRVLGFGQYYEKFQRCHLARLAIAPGFRGQGIGGEFITSLMEIGGKHLATSEFSLYVLNHNRAAVACYKGLGFRPASYPEDDPKIESCLFMTAAFD
jgi:ribosomal protein S18 acetylase RimI-like enzyme